MTTNDATLIDRDGTPTLRFERHLPVALERAWRAVTDEDEMRAWFPSAVVGERKVGAPLAFPFDDGEADTFEGEVTEWSPPSVFAFTWNGDQLRIELSAAGGDATRLVFTQTMQHRTEAARTGSGWHQCLDTLVATLGGPSADPDTWRTKYVEYLDHMGPPFGERDGDDVVFERIHFVSPDDLRAAWDDRAAWGAEDAPPAELSVGEAAFGSRFTVRVRDASAETAARWHGLLTQLDMKLASGQLVDDDAWRERIADYEKLLAS